MREMSDGFTELSTTARNAQDAIAAARRETRDKIIARREQARVAAAAAIDKVKSDLNSADTAIDGKWSALQVKLNADVARLKNRAQEGKEQLSGAIAQERASRLASDAEIAIDVARASIEDAKLAAFDALVANVETTGPSNR
jgi:hypothetical protein